MIIQITKEQLKAIIDMTDDTEAMLGNGDMEGGVDGDNDRIWNHRCILIRRMLNKNKVDHNGIIVQKEK